MILALVTFAVLQEEPATPPTPRLEQVAVVQTSGQGAEIVSVQPATRRLVVTQSASGTIELFDLADPAAPRSVRVLDLELHPSEEITSAALPPDGDWVLAAVKAGGVVEPGRVLCVSLEDGGRIAEFPCGAGPDSVVISPSGRRAVVANEGEGYDEAEGQLVSPAGGITLIELAENLPLSRVVQFELTNAAVVPTDERLLEREVGGDERMIPLDNAPMHLEPECLVFLPDEKSVLVTLQENNLVAHLALDPPALLRYLPLGNSSHTADVHKDGRFDERGALTARREPDGIALSPDGRLFLTADEGDTEPGPSQTPAGRPSGGSRTLSVFDVESGELLGDTGPDLDRISALEGVYNDGRSEKRGCEPEMVVAFERDGVLWAAVTLERAGALVLVDVSEPSRPRVAALARTGKSHLNDEPEGLARFRDPESGADYLYVANEGTGTLGVLRVSR